MGCSQSRPEAPAPSPTEALTPDEAAVRRLEETAVVVEDGMRVAYGLLSAGAALPLVGSLCEVCVSILGSVEDFGEKADDVLVAARRVVDVLETSELVARCCERLPEDERELVAARMQRLLDLLREFHAALRAFGELGWLRRAWRLHGTLHTLGRIDRRVLGGADVWIFQSSISTVRDHPRHASRPRRRSASLRPEAKFSHPEG